MRDQVTAWLPHSDKNLAELIITRRLPENHRCASDVNLSGTGVRRIPAGFTVKGNLGLRQCPRLRQIGPGLKVARVLYLGGAPDSDKDNQCYLTELPALEAGSLSLSNAPFLRTLPDGLRVKQLHLRACGALAALPENLELESLHIIGCPNLRALPRGLKVGLLVLVNAAIEELPDLPGLVQVEISGCRRLRALPPVLTAVDIRLAHLPKVTALPDMPEAARIRIRNLPGLTEVTGLIDTAELRLTKCPNLVRFDPRKFEATHLNLSSCPKLESLPPALTAEVLTLRNCTALTRLPSPLRLGNRKHPALTCLDLTRCRNLRQLPDEFTFLGAVEVTGSGLETHEQERLDFTVRFRGVALPAAAFYQPGKLNPGEVLQEQNAELRRVLLERIGMEKVLQHAGAEVIDADTDPGGPRQLLRLRPPQKRDEPLQYLQCQCPSTGRMYLLRVPPAVRTCHEAAAWLAGFSNPAAYQPILET